MREKRGRLLNLVRHVMAQFPDGVEFSKLSTIIYIADREAFLDVGHTITGRKHFAREWGVEVDGLRRVVRYMRERGELTPARQIRIDSQFSE